MGSSEFSRCLPPLCLLTQPPLVRVRVLGGAHGCKQRWEQPGTRVAKAEEAVLLHTPLTPEGPGGSQGRTHPGKVTAVYRLTENSVPGHAYLTTATPAAAMGACGTALHGVTAGTPWRCTRSELVGNTPKCCWRPRRAAAQEMGRRR